VKSKRIKGRQRKERRKGAGLRSTGRSGATHRTVRCVPDNRCMVHPTLCSWVFLATSAIFIGQSGVPAVQWLPATSTKGQRSYGAPDRPMHHKKGNHPIRRFSDASCARTVHCPVVHQTVRCTNGQKTRIAYQMELQRLLAALGL
jgi:hypothetical protein